MADYSFTMTAGEFLGVHGYVGGSVGSIDAQPIAEETLTFTVYDATSEVIGFNGLVQFDGDVSSLISTHTVWVDEVEYATNFSGFSYDEGDDVTSGSWTANAPVYVSTESYFVELKAPAAGGLEIPIAMHHYKQMQSV